MTPNPVPVPPSPPTKSSNSKGCLIALGVAFALFSVMCLIGTFFVWRAANTEEGKKIVSVIGKGAAVGMKGLNAPGTPELRDAGCRQAIVIATSDIADIANMFVDGGVAKVGPAEDEAFVLCQGNVFDSLPDCDEVARVYAKAAHPKKPFMVAVQQQGAKKSKCQGRYDTQGAFLGEEFGSRPKQPAGDE